MSNPNVLIETSLGEILVELLPEAAPKTVENFLAYVDEGFYEGTIFHRVIRDFMIQGGGMNVMLKEKPTKAPVENEAKADVKNLKGSLAMARTMDPHSASAQFFINLGDNPHLDHKEPTVPGYGYCVFGRVLDGMAVVEKIGRSRTKRFNEYDDVPVDPITITAVSRFE